MFRLYLMMGLWIAAMLTSAYASMDDNSNIFLLVSSVSMLMVIIAPMAAALSKPEAK